MNILRVMIADDEAPARQRMVDLLGDISHITLCAQAENGLEVLQLCEKYTPDILLLDIKMPVMNGLEAAQHLLKLANPPAIIFTTAFDAHALQAFDLNAVDYLLKPIRIEKLAHALQKARALLPAQLQALAPLQAEPTHISVMTQHKIKLIALVDILYFRAEQKYVVARTAKETHLLTESLNHLEATLGVAFVRLHRNCLVAKSALKGYIKQADTTGEVEGEMRWVAQLHGVEDTLIISRRQLHVLQTLFE